MRPAVLVAVVFVGCTVPENSNPTPRCEVETDCTASEHCYRGLCVPDEVAPGDAGTAIDATMPRDAETSPDAGPPEPMCDDSKAWCDERCVDTSKDDEHCGACHHRCGDDHRCHEGRCEEDD
jgi:hypothetical protein